MLFFNVKVVQYIPRVCEHDFKEDQINTFMPFNILVPTHIGIALEGQKYH